MRPLNDVERERLASALTDFGSELPPSWADAGLWTDEAMPQRIFLASKLLAASLNEASPSMVPAVAGLLVGTWSRKGFEPSLEGAYELAKNSRGATVSLKEKGVQLFLYGRDVLGESVARADPKAKRGSIAIVTNRDGEAVGLARVLAALPGRGRVLEPIIDRGWYLREGG